MIQRYAYVTQQDYQNVQGPDWPSFDQFRQHAMVPQKVYDEIDRMLHPMTVFDHPSYCVNAWHQREIYSWNAKDVNCVLMKRGPLQDHAELEHQVRQQMRQGQRPEACVECWRLEDQKLMSQRINDNRAFAHYSRRNLQDIMQEDLVQTRKIIVASSNLCNAACIYCNSNVSSYWSTIERRMYPLMPVKATHNTLDLEKLFRDVDFKNLISISFIGGEPLLDHKTFEILQHLVDQNNTKIFVSIVTNASVTLDQNQTSLLRMFDNLNFCLSIDAVGAAFEYLRWPTTWQKVLHNLEIYQSISTTTITGSCAVSNVSLMYLPQVLTWFEQNSITPYVHPVYQPVHFAPHVLPTDVKNKLASLIHTPYIKSLVTCTDREAGDLWQLTVREIQRQDQAKGINIRDYIPEFCDLVGI